MTNNPKNIRTVDANPLREALNAGLGRAEANPFVPKDIRPSERADYEQGVRDVTRLAAMIAERFGSAPIREGLDLLLHAIQNGDHVDADKRFREPSQGTCALCGDVGLVGPLDPESAAPERVCIGAAGCRKRALARRGNFDRDVELESG